MAEVQNDNYNIAGTQTVLEPVEADNAFEMEINEDDIAYYIDDEDGNEIGFALLENGVEVEYYYADDDEDCAAVAAPSAVAEPRAEVASGAVAEPSGAGESQAAIETPTNNSAAFTAAKKVTETFEELIHPSDPNKIAGISKDTINEKTAQFTEFAKDGASTAKDLIGTVNEIKDTFGLKGIKRR